MRGIWICFVEKGAKKVVATDVSKNMINSAKEKHKTNKIDFKILKMENISKLNEKFDIVYSSLAFHYVKDFNKLLKNIHSLLKPNGILIFSQESPLCTAPIFLNETDQKKIFYGEKRYSLLSDYLNETERNNYWNGVRVTKYHRTYFTLMHLLVNNKFKILQAFDSYETQQAKAVCEKYKNQADKPYFVFFKAKKLG